jgi:hypothetical protein
MLIKKIILKSAVQTNMAKQSATRRHCEYSFRTATESVMTLVEELAMNQRRSNLRLIVIARSVATKQSRKSCISGLLRRCDRSGKSLL